MTDGSGGERSGRPTVADLKVWRSIPTAVISDETGCAGVMAWTIHSLMPGHRFAGHALTVRTGRVSDGAPERVIENLGPGDVVVIDGSAHPDTAVWGGNLAAAARARGCVAVVVDGRVRDAAELRHSGLAVYARGVTPAGLVWGGEVNVTVRCGGVEVVPGALVVGDDDGVIVLPADPPPDLLARCRQRMAAEAARQLGTGEGPGGRAWRFPG